jgi:predicted RNA-binding Zn ribbon-like protein
MKPLFGKRANEHPSPNELLLAIEGELSGKEELAVNQHLQQCWECRAQSEKIRDGILDYMAYHDQLAKTMDPPPAGWSGFPYRLHNAEAEVRETRPARLAMRRQLVLAAVLLVFAGYIGYIRLGRPPSVSASEVLRLAVAAKRMPSAAPHKRLLIKHGAHSFTRDMRAAAHNPDESEVQRAFERSGWNWSDPLDPEAFAHWRDSLIAKEDRVRSEGREVTLTTAGTGGGAILEASLTLRAQDWHPMAEQVHLDDRSTVEITELPSEEGSSGPPIAAAESAVPPAAMVDAPKEPEVDEAALAKAELRARIALHQIGADLGEQIEVRRAGTQVIVKGFANTTQRKRQIDTALAGIPDLQITLHSISEMAVARAPASAAMAVASDPQPPLLRDRLLDVFHDEADRQRFVDGTLSSSQAALMRSWALRRLAERYPAEEIATLDRNSRDALRSLLNDHVKGMRMELGELRGLWKDILPNAPAPAINPSAADWQAQALKLFATMQSADQLCTWGLAADSGSGMDAPNLLRKLAGDLAEAQTWVDRLSAQFAGGDWEQPKQ